MSQYINNFQTNKMPNKPFKNILAIGGFARSGKSSSIKILRDLGIPCASSSEYLDKVLESLELSLNFKESLDLRSKKILVAEKVLVPNLSRSCLAYPAIASLIKTDQPLVGFETVGGESWELTKEIIEFLANKAGITYQIYEFNIRRTTELKGIDIRKLLVDGTDIQNNGTPEELKNQLTEWVDFFKLF